MQPGCKLRHGTGFVTCENSSEFSSNGEATSAPTERGSLICWKSSNNPGAAAHFIGDARQFSVGERYGVTNPLEAVPWSQPPICRTDLCRLWPLFLPLLRC